MGGRKVCHPDRGSLATERRPHFDSLVESGMRESMARLTVARKIAATTLTIWKKGEKFLLSKAVIRSK